MVHGTIIDHYKLDDFKKIPEKRLCEPFEKFRVSHPLELGLLKKWTDYFKTLGVPFVVTRKIGVSHLGRSRAPESYLHVYSEMG